MSLESAKAAERLSILLTIALRLILFISDGKTAIDRQVSASMADTFGEDILDGVSRTQRTAKRSVSLAVL